MPVWNGEKYLAAAIESILGQTFREFEFIIVDDGSSDSTAQILASYSDSRIKIHRLPHGGIVAALDYGISQAQAAWIARQDADDISLPERLEVQWQAIQRRPHTVLCFTDVMLVGENAADIKRAHFPRTKGFTALRLCYQSPIVHGAVMIDKGAFYRAGGYREDERHAEDYGLWARLLEEGEFVSIQRRLVKLRVHAASVSQNQRGIQVGLSEKLAIEHCKRFMNLDKDQAGRAFAVLRAPALDRTAEEWWWFVTTCIRGLRWKSAEVYSWLFLQSLKQLLRV